MKLCRRCGEAKESTDFNGSPKNRDGLHSYCRECQKAYYRENYDRHLANVRRSAALRTQQLRSIVFAAMSGGCVDCGERDIRVLEFDHVVGTKIRSIGDLVRRGASERVLREEIKKCELRCRNCHARATIRRRGGSWHDQFDTGPPGGI